jgi:hypothetical protein
MIAEKTQINRAIEASTAWRSLSKTIRWKPFQDASESDETWRDLLGPTVVVGEHQTHFADFAFVLAQMEGLDRDRLRLHYLADLVHDLGEAEVPPESGIETVGDVAEQTRLKNQDENEREVLIAFYFLGRLELPPHLLGELIIAYRKVVAGDDEVEFAFFDAIQRAEYIDTIIHAYRQLKAGKPIVNIQSMIARVLMYDFPKVLNTAEIYPKSIGAYLLANQADLQEMFGFATAAHPHLPERFAYPIEKLEASEHTWLTFLQEHQRA